MQNESPTVGNFVKNLLKSCHTYADLLMLNFLPHQTNARCYS